MVFAAFPLVKGQIFQTCKYKNDIPLKVPKGARKGFFGAFQGDSMHFRGHSRRNAPLLPPFVVYYRHRAVLCNYAIPIIPIEQKTVR